MLLFEAVDAVNYNCHVANKAAEDLGKCRDTGIVPDVIAAMIESYNQGDYIAFYLANALGKLCREKAPPELLSILKRNANWYWCFGIVAVALKYIGDRNVVPALVDALHAVEESRKNCYNLISDTLHFFGHSGGKFCYDRDDVRLDGELVDFTYAKRPRKKNEINTPPWPGTMSNPLL